jgi:hypothetical protein
MRGKLQTNVHSLSDSSKARILRDLRRGDQSIVAELSGASPLYVKDILRKRRADKSTLARRVWLCADRLLKSRARLKDEFRS